MKDKEKTSLGNAVQTYLLTLIEPQFRIKLCQCHSMSLKKITTGQCGAWSQTPQCRWRTFFPLESCKHRRSFTKKMRNNEWSACWWSLFQLTGPSNSMFLNSPAWCLVCGTCKLPAEWWPCPRSKGTMHRVLLLISSPNIPQSPIGGLESCATSTCFQKSPSLQRQGAGNKALKVTAGSSHRAQCPPSTDTRRMGLWQRKGYDFFWWAANLRTNFVLHFSLSIYIPSLWKFGCLRNLRVFAYSKKHTEGSLQF